MEPQGPSSRNIARITLVVVGVLVGLYGVYLVRQILVLVLVAAFLAIGLDPMVRAVQRGPFRRRRGLAVAVVFIGMLLLIAGFFAAVTPPLVRQTVRLAQNIPDFAERLSDRSTRFGELDARFDVSDKLRDLIDDLPNRVAGSAGRALGFVSSVGSTLISFLTVTVLTIYFLIDLPKIELGFMKLFPRSRRDDMKEHFDVFFRSIGNYIVGNLATSLVAGVISFIAFTIIGVPYALPLAIWVAIADLIPLVGALIGAIPAVIVGFFDALGTGIATAVFCVAYQQFENYVVQPRVMRQAVDISAAAVLLAALIGATLLGFVGALIAIPIAASIKVIFQRTWIPRQETA